MNISEGTDAGTGSLRLSQKLGYATGDFGLNLFWQSINLFLLFFYTDILGISPVWAGVAYMVASIWDGITDPIMGILADRTRTKWGKFRPYLLFGAIPLAISLVLAFSSPGKGYPEAVIVAWAMGSHVLLRTTYTVLSIPYSSLSARMTHNADDRTSLTGYRMQASSIGQIVVSFLFPFILDHYGNQPIGFTIAASCVALMSLPAFLVCFCSTAEQSDLDTDTGEQPKMSWRSLGQDVLAFFRILANNGPLLRIFLIVIIVSIAITMYSKNLIYYFKYDLKDMSALKVVLPMLPVVSILAIPLWVQIIKRTSKRDAFLLASAAGSLALLALFFNPYTDTWINAAILICISASLIAYAVCFWSMLPDTVEYGEWKTGERHEAKVFGFSSFAQKVALGIAAFILGAALEFIGFVPNATQSEETLFGLRALIALVPIAGIVASAALVWGYPINATFHAQIREEIEARRKASVTHE
jgi:glycoside/pentoside/hexuronide:cation symporter, GPH family